MLKKTLTVVVVGAAFILGMLIAVGKKDLLGDKKTLKSDKFFEDVDIYSVENGFKLVNAKTFEGAIYGLGMVHARDRLW